MHRIVSQEPVNKVPLIANALVNIRSSSDLNYESSVSNIILKAPFEKTWSPDSSDKNSFVLLGGEQVKEITGMAIKGNIDTSMYVESFKFRYTLDNIHWQYLGDQPIPANTDSKSIVYIEFTRAILARSISIHPQSFKGTFPAMRMELYSNVLLATSYVQVGTFQLGAKSVLNYNNGERKVVKNVIFDKVFPGLIVPTVKLSLSLVSTEDCNNAHFWVSASNITNRGFDLEFNANYDAKVYDLVANYFAFQTLQ
ncbi:discoidin II [Tieghemostelium lacteum]|uniref:Discoidin II n=1 Tax=Tieghemostelium lacteum TaxID=361077 RepID=A0A152A1S3_TIELA|nr:discoidin II [Tieghemostelium lacteum]|eukprot:KYR00021.1 discoidin II [Tieghemostelium lacteum]